VLIVDVNVLVYAHRPESPQHASCREWLQQAVLGPEPFGVVDSVLASFLRIVTHHRVFLEPTPTATALAFCDGVKSAPAAMPVQPGPDHWQVFSDLLTGTTARGNLVPDAYLAALAIEQGATFVTTDAGFARFPALRRTSPLS
jgi:toxin-antitoxin system PIN domain toxin